MAETTVLHDDEQDAGIEHPLWLFLNALSGVNDELERARLIATAVPSLIPCRISGVAIVDSVGKRWHPVFQKDGRPLAKVDTDRMLVELEPSFDAAFSQAPVLACETSDAKLWQFMVELGVCHLAVAPLMTVKTRLGVLFVGRHALEPFSRREQQILATIAEHSAIGIENLCLHRELQQYARRLEQRTADLESFAYSVSHDLRAPLRAMHGFSRILIEDYSDKLDAECNRLLGVIHENAQNMGRLIDDLLAFSRFGRQAMSLTRIDMAQLAQNVFDELVSGIAEGELDLKVKRLPYAYGDPAMIRQVLINILSNAIKFTRLEATRVVAVDHFVEDEESVFCVSDNGVGFDMQYVQKLFQIFQRLHTTAEFEGTGVGLAIAQRIVQRHGGRIWAEGAVGEGATIYFTLSARGESAC